MKDSQQLLLQAQQNAEGAKEAALGAISRFYQQSQVSEKKAEKMVRELDEAIQHALDATKKSRGKIQESDRKTAQDGDLSAEYLLSKDKKLKLSKKVLNNGPLGTVSDITKSFFGSSKELDPEVKAEFYQYVMRHSPQLRQLINDLTDDKAKIKAERVISEAKSKIIAARVAVNHAQEEINDAKEKAKKAIGEADPPKKGG